MRKPRDIDAELKALADKAKALKVQRTQQLGELVTLTGAADLDPEILAGALLAIGRGVQQLETKEVWRREGADFFQRGSRTKKSRGGPSGDQSVPHPSGLGDG